MGRFLKLNSDMQTIASKLLENQDLCKLLAYEGNNPLSMPRVKVSELMDKRVLFSSKIFGVDEVGSYLMIRVSGGKPKGNQFIISDFFFDIMVHQDARKIINGERSMFIADIIMDVMSEIDFSVGEINLFNFFEISSNDGRFAGYRLVYKDFDFKLRV